MNKKEKESFSFSKFSQLYFGHEILFKQPNPPEPDFVFSYENKKIGCELTTIFIDNEPGQKYSATKKYESIQRIICKNVQEWLVETIPGRFEVQLYFNNKLIPDSEIKKISNKVIQVIENNISDLNLEESSRIMVEDRDKIPFELDYVRIRTFPRLQRSLVTQAGGSAIPKLNRERIISNIKHKENRIKNYIHLTDSNWLLLIINESIFSSEFDLTAEEYGNINTLFDKVFIFSHSDQKIVTIK